MQRIHSIDTFRGIAIILMVFFTLMIKLSPEAGFFDHNNYSEVHVGDFVLPLFLFASGMSLVFYVKKREGKPKTEYWMDNIERFGKLFGIGMLLSIFSAGMMFGMDEVSLSAILFLLTILLMRFSNIFFLIISLVLAIVYFALFHLGYVNIFEHAYLGGYPAALFYFPVMLAGAALGKGIMNGKLKETAISLLIICAALSLVFIILFPIDKMRVSPSFMSISILISTILFISVHKFFQRFKSRIPALEFLGQKPIKYWVLMFIFFLVPYNFCFAFGSCPYPLDFSLLESLTISSLFMMFIGVISYIINRMIILIGDSANKLKLFKP
jgi:predicted acyltransferase